MLGISPYVDRFRNQAQSNFPDKKTSKNSVNGVVGIEVEWKEQNPEVWSRATSSRPRSPVIARVRSFGCTAEKPRQSAPAPLSG